MPATMAHLSFAALEIAAAVLLVVMAATFPISLPQSVERGIGRARKFARQRRRAVLVVGLLALTGRLALLPIVPIPTPSVHDEFSYLLAADTFASGRLANPTHPMWPFFESFHIIQVPTYMSMYFPGQGLLLAAGKVLFGHPWIALLLASAALCAAICWMLQGWMPAEWAFLGGLLAVIRLGLFSYWVNSYWSGALPALGGAMVLGALPRFLRGQRTRHGWILACGIAILALTRPFEGLILCLPVAIRLAMAWLKHAKQRPGILRNVCAPAVVMMAVVATAMLYYDTRVTGRALEVPYRTNYRQYMLAGQFVWEAPRPVISYRHPVMRSFYVDQQLAQALDQRTFGGFLSNVAFTIEQGGLFFFGAILLIPLFWLPRTVRDRRTRFLAVSMAVFAVGILMNKYFTPHYAAPATAIIYALLLQSMRHMRHAGSRGLFLSRAIPAACVVLVALRLFAGSLNLDVTQWHFWYATTRQGGPRAEVMSQLEKLPGGQLVVVEYAPGHNPEYEWVYNRADIDASKVVWARDMGAENSKLLNYFHDRTAWVVQPDCLPVRVTPYRGPGMDPPPCEALDRASMR
jgi:hypothetical protein